jgi:hypothetical protein
MAILACFYDEAGQMGWMIRVMYALLQNVQAIFYVLQLPTMQPL